MATRTLRLAQLSPEQEALLPAIRDEWLAHGLSTSPTDRKGAEQGIALAYQAAGLKPPATFIWLGSPFAGAIGSAMLARAPKVRAQVGAQVWDQVWDQVGAQVWDQVWDQVGDQVWDQVRAQVGDQVWDQVGDQVWDQVRAQVGAQVRDQVRAQVGAQVRDQVRAAAWGQYDAYWLSFYDTFKRFGLADLVAPLAGLMQQARSAGWWWPFRGAAVVTERPRVLSRDDRGRLHSESGPAVGYPDGWGVWAWHGVRVAREVIEAPETLTADQVTAEQNVEIRRVMIERMGTARYLRESGATKVHADDWGTLWREDVPGDEPIVMVAVVNSTPEPDGSFKDYWLRVDPRCRTAKEAVAWSFAETVSTYDPAVQT